MNKSDLVRHLDAVSRVVGTRDVDGRTANVIQATRSFAATREEIWAAMTDPERIPRWFLPISGDLRLGGRFQLEGNAAGEIIRCEPPHTLAVTWEFGGDVSWVDVRLHADNGGTRLVLEHTALPSDHWETYGPGATGVGWDLGLFGLDRYLAGAKLDAAAFEAWSVTEPGKACVQQSARAWVDAAHASGLERELAELQGRRTAAFYTGEPEPKA